MPDPFDSPHVPVPPDSADSVGPPSATSSGGAAPGSLRRGVLARLVQIGASMLVFVAVLFGVAGTWDWPAAWLLIGLYAGLLLVAGFVFAPRHQAVVAARSRTRLSEAPWWDRVFVVVWSLLSVAVPAVGALDHRRNGPADWPLFVVAIGAIGLALAYGLLMWSMAANPFFEPVVRIQRDRGHVVMTGGPYAFVRHPGYVGGVFVVLMMPLMLRSPWALACAFVGLAVIIMRTAMEDRFLQEQLAGYADYARRVRYRLLPGVW